MLIKDSIDTIERLLKEDTEASLTYAALECRLAIERICYERLRIVHDYIAHDDLKKWQPHEVIKILTESIEPSIAKTFTLSMSKHPVADGPMAVSLEEFQSMEYVTIGTQSGFDPNRLRSLWNALSRVALHVNVPKSSSDPIRPYGDKSNISAKVSEVLDELRRIDAGNLISSGFGEEVSFQCYCGQRNKRKIDLLKDSQVVSCIRPECGESYSYSQHDCSFERRTVLIICRKCQFELVIPKKTIEQLHISQRIHYDCDCGETISIKWHPMHGQRTKPKPKPNTLEHSE